MPLPLPEEYQQALATINDHEAPNAGLIFDRMPDHWAEGWGKVAPGAKTEFLTRVARFPGRQVVRTYLADLHRRRDALIQSLHGQTFDMATTWRFVSGLGAAHILENGFVWDRNLGIPYVPGSSVKGALHAWAKDWASNDDAEFKTQFAAWFGDTADLGAGSIIVHDAFPLEARELEIDVMSVQVPGYYRSGGAQPPADSESPIIIPFLTVPPGTTFRFALSPRPPAQPKPDLARAVQRLQEALETLGLGSKTAAGYGHFSR